MKESPSSRESAALVHLVIELIAYSPTVDFPTVPEPNDGARNLGARASAARKRRDVDVSALGDARAHARMEFLVDWSRARGVRWSDETLEVKNVSTSGGAGDDRGVTHRGIFATRAIAGDREEDLVVIPRRAMIACGGDGGEADTGRRDEGARRGGDAEEAQDELAIELLRRRSAGTRDEFAEYINSMPTDYNLLQSWSEEEIDALQDAQAKALALRRREQIRRAYARNKDRLVDLLGEGGASFSDYEWARATVSSRAVSVPFHAAGALCPMGDMFNYAPPDAPELIEVVGAPMHGTRDCLDDCLETRVASRLNEDARPVPGYGVYDDVAKTFAFKTARQPEGRRGVREDEEIYVCYGEYSNLQLLDFYGFTLAPDENPQDSYTLDVNGSPLQVFVGGFSWTDLANLRVLIAIQCASTTKAKINEKAIRDIARRGGALGAEAELRTFSAVRDAAAETLLSFPTTAQSDVEALNAPTTSLSENMRLAITWRLCAKRIVQRAYRWADARCAEADAEVAATAVSTISLAHVRRPKSSLKGGTHGGS